MQRMIRPVMLALGSSSGRQCSAACENALPSYPLNQFISMLSHHLYGQPQAWPVLSPQTRDSCLASTHGFSTSARQESSSTWPESHLVLPLPKLSPQMTHGTITKWHKAQGDTVQAYEVVCEVSTRGLVESAYAVGDFAGEVTLLIESQEDGVISQILLQEGQEAPVGTPAAVVAEEGAQSASTSSSPTASSSSTEGSSQGHSAVPTTNVYDDAQPRVRVLEWQSYLKDGSQGTSSAGCS